MWSRIYLFFRNHVFGENVIIFCLFIPLFIEGHYLAFFYTKDKKILLLRRHEEVKELMTCNTFVKFLEGRIK